MGIPYTIVQIAMNRSVTDHVCIGTGPSTMVMSLEVREKEKRSLCWLTLLLDYIEYGSKVMYGIGSQNGFLPHFGAHHGRQYTKIRLY